MYDLKMTMTTEFDFVILFCDCNAAKVKIKAMLSLFHCDCYCIESLRCFVHPTSTGVSSSSEVSECQSLNGEIGEIDSSRNLKGGFFFEGFKLE